MGVFQAISYYDESQLFMTHDLESMALENLANRLKPGGSLSIVLPAKVTFAGGGHTKLRQCLTDTYAIKRLFMMPDGAFRPYMSVNRCSPHDASYHLHKDGARQLLPFHRRIVHMRVNSFPPALV